MNSIRPKTKKKSPFFLNCRSTVSKYKVPIASLPVSGSVHQVPRDPSLRQATECGGSEGCFLSRPVAAAWGQGPQVSSWDGPLAFPSRLLGSMLLAVQLPAGLGWNLLLPVPFLFCEGSWRKRQSYLRAGAAQGSREDADDGKPPLPPGGGLKSSEPRWLRVPRLGFGYESSSLRKRRWFLHWAEILCKSRVEGSASHPTALWSLPFCEVWRRHQLSGPTCNPSVMIGAASLWFGSSYLFSRPIPVLKTSA